MSLIRHTNAFSTHDDCWLSATFGFLRRKDVMMFESRLDNGRYGDVLLETGEKRLLSFYFLHQLLVFCSQNKENWSCSVLVTPAHTGHIFTAFS